MKLFKLPFATGIEFEIADTSFRVGIRDKFRVLKVREPENEDVHGKEIDFLWFGFAWIRTADRTR